jgi:hypothetical protein
MTVVDGGSDILHAVAREITVRMARALAKSAIKVGLESRNWTSAAAIVVATLMPGCSDGRPERVPVSGQVLIDGKPLTYGYVKFVKQGSRPAGGYVDEQGRFKLSCYTRDDGAIPGRYQVEVNAGESLSATQRKWHAPKKYARYDASGLEQEITEATDTVVINLTWDGGKPFTERAR